MPQRSQTDEPLQPLVEVTPAGCRMVRRALDSGVAAFERWGIETPPGSWIQDAASWLDQVAARNSLGANDEELKRTSAAIALAVDLYHIGTCLGEEANRQVAAELASIYHGRLLGRGDSAAGKDYLTQFWVGALLAQSKLSPRLIATISPAKRSRTSSSQRAGSTSRLKSSARALVTLRNERS